MPKATLGCKANGGRTLTRARAMNGFGPKTPQTCFHGATPVVATYPVPGGEPSAA